MTLRTRNILQNRNEVKVHTAFLTYKLNWVE